MLSHLQSCEQMLKLSPRLNMAQRRNLCLYKYQYTHIWPSVHMENHLASMIHVHMIAKDAVMAASSLCACLHVCKWRCASNHAAVWICTPAHVLPQCLHFITNARWPDTYVANKRIGHDRTNGHTEMSTSPTDISIQPTGRRRLREKPTAIRNHCKPEDVDEHYRCQQKSTWKLKGQDICFSQPRYALWLWRYVLLCSSILQHFREAPICNATSPPKEDLKRSLSADCIMRIYSRDNTVAHDNITAMQNRARHMRSKAQSKQVPELRFQTPAMQSIHQGSGCTCTLGSRPPLF